MIRNILLYFTKLIISIINHILREVRSKNGFNNLRKMQLWL